MAALRRFGRFDFEIDGRAFHSDADRFQRDRTRQNRLVGAGWTVLRFTWNDLRDRPGVRERGIADFDLRHIGRGHSDARSNRGGLRAAAN